MLGAFQLSMQPILVHNTTETYTWLSREARLLWHNRDTLEPTETKSFPMVKCLSKLIHLFTHILGTNNVNL